MRKLILLALIVLFASYTSNAQAEKYKALFVYNFTKHIEWPASSKTGDFIIGIVNQKQLTDRLIAITNGKKVGAQNIVIQLFSSIEEITNCNIIIMGSNNSTPKRIAATISQVGESTLIVTNGNNSATKGATINFTIKEGKLKFELSKANASQRGLKISTYLQNLAVIVG